MPWDVSPKSSKHIFDENMNISLIDLMNFSENFVILFCSKTHFHLSHHNIGTEFEGNIKIMFYDHKAEQAKFDRRSAALAHASADLDAKRGGPVIALANAMFKQRGEQATAKLANRTAETVRANYFGKGR